MEELYNLMHTVLKQLSLRDSRPETTMIYTHVARKDLMNIKSPLDRAVEALKKLDQKEQKVTLSRK